MDDPEPTARRCARDFLQPAWPGPVERWRGRRRPLLRCFGAAGASCKPTGLPLLSDENRQPLEERDGPRDECGRFGVFAPEHDVSRLAYFALYALQHRGQESAGIATALNGHIMTLRDLGLVSQVFDEQKLRALTGDMALGHVRYSTTGSSAWENAQPVHRSDNRELALAHNGNLINARRAAHRAARARDRPFRPPATRRSSPRCSRTTRRMRSRTPSPRCCRACRAPSPPW